MLRKAIFHEWAGFERSFGDYEDSLERLVRGDYQVWWIVQVAFEQEYNWKWLHRIIFSQVNATLWYASPLTRSYSSLKFDRVVQIDLFVEEDRSCLKEKFSLNFIYLRRDSYLQKRLTIQIVHNISIFHIRKHGVTLMNSQLQFTQLLKNWEVERSMYRFISSTFDCKKVFDIFNILQLS